MLRRFHPGLGIKLMILALVGVAIGFPISSGITWLAVARQTEVKVGIQIENELDVFQSRFNREVDDLGTVGHWLVGQRSFRSMVRTENSSGLVALLEPLTQASIVDSIVVANRGGRVLARVRVDEPPTQGDDISSQDGFKEALAGESTSGMEQDRSGRLQGRLILPVAEDASIPSIGVLILGFDVAENFTTNLPKPADFESMVVYKDHVAVFAQNDREAKPWVGRVAPGEVLQAEREQRESDFVMLDTATGAYRFKFRPIHAPSQAIIGMFGLGVNEATLNAERADLVRYFGLGLLAALLDVLIVVYLAARMMLIPLKQLQRAVVSITAGDSTLPLELPRSQDEFGQLAAELETMRTEMADRLQSAALAKERLEAVFYSQRAAIMVTDRSLVAMINPAAETLLHANSASVVGHPWRELLDESQGVEPATDRVPDDDRTLVPNGKFCLHAEPTIMLQVSSTPVQVKGKTFGYVHLLQDVSVQDKLMRSKDEFVLNLAHELRGPLASLRGTIDLLSEEYLTMTKRDLRLMVRAMQKALGRFQTLVENLIDMGSMQAGRFSIRAGTTDLRKMFTDVIRMIEPLLAAREQSLDAAIDLPENYVLSVDRPRLIQVVFNLLNNASKYGPEGEPIILCVSRRNGFVIVGVTDKGPGIPPEEQVHLFERYYRAKRIDQEGSGIGLGLALARGIVVAHGGEIGLESQEGQGTTFWFTLPEAEA